MPQLIATIPNTPRPDIIVYRTPFDVISCAVGKQPYHGTLSIQYAPTDVLLEFESFDLWLAELCLIPQTIEQLCRRVYDALTSVLLTEQLCVEVHAETVVHGPATAIIDSFTN